MPQNLRTRHGCHANPAMRYESTARERASDTTRTPAALAQVLASKPAASPLLPDHIRARRRLELEVAGIQRGIGLEGAKAQHGFLAKAVQNLQRRQSAVAKADTQRLAAELAHCTISWVQ